MSTPDYFCKGRPAHPLRCLLESDAARCILCKAACDDKCNLWCPNLYLRCVFFSLLFIPYHGASVLLHAEMAQNRASVHLHSSSIPSTLRLARSCSALPPVCFPFTDAVPPSLPSSLCCSILLIFVSLAGQGLTRAEERGRGGCRNVKLLLILSDYSITTFWGGGLFLVLLYLLGSFSWRWQSVVSDSEVGPLDSRSCDNTHTFVQYMHYCRRMCCPALWFWGMYQLFIDAVVCFYERSLYIS